MPQMAQPARFQKNAGSMDFIHAGVGASAKDRSWVLGAPPADGHVDDGHIDGGKDGEDGRESLALTGGGEAAQQQIADIEKPEEQHAGEASVPCPPDSPGGASPRGAA